MYNAPSYHPSSFESQPDNLPLYHSSLPQTFTAATPLLSAAQRRVLVRLRQRCATFIMKERSYRHSASDINMDPLSFFSTAIQTEHLIIGTADADLSSLLPPTASFSSSTTAVVPLIAKRIALPDSLTPVPILSILPPALAERYRLHALPSLLRPMDQLQHLNTYRPLKPARIAGTRSEYIDLLRRMLSIRMVDMTARPKAVNGVFAVGKDKESDRLIIDAQPANRLLIDSPTVKLPNPSHLVQLRVPRDTPMYTAKSDLSNFYHHMGLPKHLQPYFALPPLLPRELEQLGLDPRCPYPMCTTMPMGFSHAVFIGQSAHQHMLYSTGALHEEDDLLQLASPDVTSTRAIHGIVIDDFFLFSLSSALAQRVLNRVLVAYRQFGFVVKQSKVVQPTSKRVKVIGFDICGEDRLISLPIESQHSLLTSTHRALAASTISGRQLSKLIGRWTWVMLLRRPSLAILQHVYRYIAVARNYPFTMWMCVRRELRQLVGLLPLLEVDLAASIFHRAIATDASELAGGMVITPITPHLQQSLWTICSSKQHATLQAILNKDSNLDALDQLGDTHSYAVDQLHHAALAYDDVYSSIGLADWKVIVSREWRGYEHINVLELRAALLAVHWLLTYPSALDSRAYILIDSAVSFFSLWKGRSSSPSLLLVLRKLSALLLAGNITLLPGWIPSAVNPADAPSRLV